MWRRVAYGLLVGSVLAALGACGSLFDAEEREPWRAEVEAACLASGQVHETAGIRLTEAVEGPGACGVDRPFRVSALDTQTPLGFAAMMGGLDLPPVPADVPGAAALSPPPPVAETPQPEGAYTPLPELPAIPGQTPPPAVQLRDGAPFSVSLDRSLILSCSMVPALTRWLSTQVQPAALSAFGSPVVEMVSYGSYSCRRRNNAKRGRLSEHAFANAVDVRAFKLADGRQTSVLKGWNGTPEERQFWRDALFGACTGFTTVLGPGSADGLHENHLHLDLARHSTQKSVHVCRPRVPQGWVAAAERNGGLMPQPQFAGTIEEPLSGEIDQ